MSASEVQTTTVELRKKGEAARRAARLLAKSPSSAKSEALRLIAEGLSSRRDEVLTANSLDLHAGRQNGHNEAFLDRLLLTADRLDAMASDVLKVRSLPDPVGEELDTATMPNGLRVGKRRVPLGVIGVIYESRPNVTVDIATLCLKSGNAAILRGGKEAINSNMALARVIRDAVAAAGIPQDAVQLIESTDRALVGEMLSMKDTIDLVIPRGGAELVRRVAEEASMPAVTGGVGVCHTYVDGHASVDMAVDIVYNSKVQRPSVCNALDSLLVHVDAAPRFLPAMARRWADVGVEMRCDRRALSILEPIEGVRLLAATEQDWDTEFLSLALAVRVVDSADEAIDHIDRHGTGHTEAIVTEDDSTAMRFLDEVDSGVVLVNASTRFNDGGQLGLGAEAAISTSKMHARGPMGLRELTSYKWTVLGTGQIRS